MPYPAVRVSLTRFADSDARDLLGDALINEGLHGNAKNQRVERPPSLAHYVPTMHPREDMRVWRALECLGLRETPHDLSERQLKWTVFDGRLAGSSWATARLEELEDVRVFAPKKGARWNGVHEAFEIRLRLRRDSPPAEAELVVFAQAELSQVGRPNDEPVPERSLGKQRLRVEERLALLARRGVRRARSRP